MRRLSMPLEEQKNASTKPKVRGPLWAWVTTRVIWLAIGPATSLGQASSSRAATWSASSSVPNRKPVSAVTKIRNGNSDISVDSAMWLAIAQPAARPSAIKASLAMRYHGATTRKGYSVLVRNQGRLLDNARTVQWRNIAKYIPRAPRKAGAGSGNGIMLHCSMGNPGARLHLTGGGNDVASSAANGVRIGFARVDAGGADRSGCAARRRHLQGPRAGDGERPHRPGPGRARAARDPRARLVRHLCRGDTPAAQLCGADECT